MKKRTNTAFWVEKEKRWCIAVQKNGTRKRFYSSTPGRTGQREANAKADAWLDDSIRDGKKKVSALYAQWVEELKLTCGTSYVEQCKKYGDYYILPVCGDIRIGKLPALLIVCGFFRVRPSGRTLFLFCHQSSNPWLPATFFRYSSGSPFRISSAYASGSL